MKNGSNIVDLAKRLQDLRENSRDYLVPATRLKDSLTARVTEGSELALTIRNGDAHDFVPSKYAHGQIAEYADIPREYYGRLNAGNPGLLSMAVNYGFSVAAGQLAGRDSGRMLRTHGGALRGFVSSRYRRLDNFDLFEAIAPALIDLGFDPESAELTDKRMYLKVVSPKVEAEIGVGDVVRYGLVVSNSDVGAGSVRVEPMLYRLVCSNGLITETAIRKAHLGNNMGAGLDSVEHLLTDDTKRKNDAAFFATVRDVVRNFAKPEFFEAEVARVRDAAAAKVTMYDLPLLVERTAKRIGVSLNGGVKESIIDNLASGAHGAGLTKWGLTNAFTFGAQHASLDYDAATDLERAGNAVLSLNARAWEEVNAK